jgi:heat shock protein HtpX
MTSRVSPNELLGEVFDSVKQQSGVKKPVSLYLVNTASPLAFAMGAPFRGTVVLSQGLVNGLEPDEVRWVMAHELAHIRYRDMLLGALWISSIRGLNIFDRIKVFAINLILRILGLLRAPRFIMHILIGAIRLTLSTIRLGRWIAVRFFLLIDRWVSRTTEFRADKFAADKIGPEPGARALYRLGGDAEPLFNGLFATHPKISARIQRLMPS